MDALPSTSEIVEAIDDSETEIMKSGQTRMHFIAKSGKKCSIEEDINRLFEGIDMKSSSRGVSGLQDVGKDTLKKSAMKKPIKAGSSQASRIGISEPVSLKQALRGLCISQASEMAAMKKRLSTPGGSSRVSEAGTITRMYRAVVVEANGSRLPINDDTGDVVEISLVPEKNAPNSSEQGSETVQVPMEASFGLHSNISNPLDDAVSTKQSLLNKLPSVDQIVPLAEESENEVSKTEFKKLKCVDSSAKMAPVSTKAGVETPVLDKAHEGKLHSGTSLSISCAGGRIKPAGDSPHLVKQVFRNKSFIRRKAKREPSSSLSSSVACNGTVGGDLGPSTSYSGSPSQNHILENGRASPAFSGSNYSFEVSSSTTDSGRIPVLRSKHSSKTKPMVNSVDDGSRSRGKGEFSQSSKSSIGDYSSSTSTSEESSLSMSARIASRPHMSKDFRWEAIHSSEKKHGSLGLKHFKLIRKLGCGDIGIVYLAELVGMNCLFALKVMDNEFLVSRKKLARAQTEKEILQMLDHPFLPTLYAHFLTDKYSCLVMEYCPGGDLHILRQKQPGRNFSEQASRFYVAEVLLALEYLHMLGVVYRDLKPENILVREDGHIMLSDFDLSLRCAVDPVLVKSSPASEPAEKMSSPCSDSSCIEPFCLNPSFQVPCFTPRLLSLASKSRKVKCDRATQVNPMPQLVVEPTSARSNSFVGTHEYLAPEIIKGEGHGNAVDWWTFGILLFELLYGKTPFKGSGNDETLANVVSNSLRFPSSPMVSFHARDLITGLLVKEPERRLGSVKGAAEIKQHPFFDGLNWALIRCATPPEMPKSFNASISQPSGPTQKNDSIKCEELQSTEEQMEFDMF